MYFGRYQESFTDFVDLGIVLETKLELQADLNYIQYNFSWDITHLEMCAEATELFGYKDINSVPRMVANNMSVLNTGAAQ